MSGVVRLQGTLLRRILPLVNRRLISSTPQKKSETACAEPAKTAITNKNWMSYGFDVKDESDDQNAYHSIFFATVTVCMVLGGFLMVYLPDYGLRDWAQREAFLELRRREANGLPLIDRNLIDPAKIQLPSDEELGDTEIII